MTASTETAREIAREIVDQAMYDAVIPDVVADVLASICARHIAEALVAARREGIERAAEIARKVGARIEKKALRYHDREEYEAYEELEVQVAVASEIEGKIRRIRPTPPAPKGGDRHG